MLKDRPETFRLSQAYRIEEASANHDQSSTMPPTYTEIVSSVIISSGINNDNGNDKAATTTAMPPTYYEALKLD